MTVLIKRSSWLLTYLLCAHLIAIFTVWLIQIDVILSSVLTVVIVASLFVYCRQYRDLPTGKRLIKLRLDKHNDCFLDFSDNSQQGPYRLKGSVIFNPALVLYLRSDRSGLSKPIFIARDAVIDKAWRQLRIRLRDPDSWG